MAAHVTRQVISPRGHASTWSVQLQWIRIAVVGMALALDGGLRRAEAQVTTRVSIASDGSQASADGTSPIALSADGRFVAFVSADAALVPGDTNGVADVFVHDRQTSATTRVSVASGGLQADAPSSAPAINADGGIVAFHSSASNLVPGDVNGVDDVFVHDRATGETNRVSVASGGTQIDGRGYGASISADGQIVGFTAENAWGYRRACVHDRRTHATRCLLSPPPATPPVYGWSYVPLWSEAPSVSADGRTVLATETWNLYGFPILRAAGVLHDLESGETRAINSTGTLAGGARHVVSSGGGRVTVLDLESGVSERVDVGFDGSDGNGESWSPSISADGRFVAFSSYASNLVPQDNSAAADAFVHDRTTGATYRASVASDGTPARFGTGTAAISASGKVVAFASPAANLVAGDSNRMDDVFVHGLDADEDELPAGWETAFGLDPRSPAGIDGAAGDPDNDGITNAREYLEGTHPTGLYARYLAEGGSSTFFAGTRLAVLNVEGDNRVLLRFLGPGGTQATRLLALDGRTRVTVDAARIEGISLSEFSTVIESRLPVVVDRLMTWDVRKYGAHAETAQASPSLTWYVAEGATHGGFALFYLLQNPNASALPVTVTYLRPAPAPPLAKTYIVPARSRVNVWVNDEARTDPALAGLAASDVSARFEAPQPIFVERAMYLNRRGPDGVFDIRRDVLFEAGHASSAVSAPALQWFLAEGATGPYFDEFILIANPGDTTAQVEVRYLLGEGTTLTRRTTCPRRAASTSGSMKRRSPRLARRSRTSPCQRSSPA